MDPKTTAAGLLGVFTGVWTSSGIVDNPALLMWLVMGSLAGSVASLTLSEHGRAPREVRSWLAVIGQGTLGMMSGLCATPLAITIWQESPPYRPDHVLGVAFGVAMLSWLLLDWLLPPLIQRLRKRVKSGGLPGLGGDHD